MADKVYFDSEKFTTCVDSMETKCEEIELEELNFYYSCQSDAMDKMISSYENLISAINDYKAILNSDIQVLKKVDQAMLEQNENAKNKVDENIKVG